MLIRAFTVLLTLLLLSQAVATFWAAVPVANAAVAAEQTTPPCHGAADEAPQPALTPDLTCCGDLADCRCAVGCGAASAPATGVVVGIDYLRASLDRRTVSPQPLAAHPSRLLRPPAVHSES